MEQAIDISTYADSVAQEKVFMFAGKMWIPVVEGYNNDPSLMIAKVIVDMNVQAPEPANLAQPEQGPSPEVIAALEEQTNKVEAAKAEVMKKRKKGEGLAKAKAGLAKKNADANEDATEVQDAE